MTTPSRIPRAVFAMVLFTGAGAVKAQEPAPALGGAFDEGLFKSMEWREVGPFRGGRVAAVCGVASEPLVYYFGACGGGVWKTIDGGVSWKNISDGFFGGSIGAVAVCESDPNVIYVGGGEKTVRGNVSHGDGMWKSTDAGRTWTRAGLENSRHIPRIRIHPKNSEIIYAAVLGHLFGPSEDRGVYRSKDGGRNWERILFVNSDAGAVDLILDPTNPRILYATTWRVRRTPHSLESGGEGSGLWSSEDGGDTWKELSANKGLPKPPLGIIGITVSPSNARNIYSIVEAEGGGVFRSRDGGANWEKTNSDRNLRQRAWYYSRIYADPKDEDIVYVVNVAFHRSKDGGRTFTTIPTPHGDNHDLWIAPDDPQRMIESNDGGANVSTDGGRNWSRQDNQPTSQIYRVSTDTDFPYRLLGGQQDNSALRIRHRSTGGGIGLRDWEPTAGGESGHVVAHPRDPDLVFGGSYGGYLQMLHHRTGERRGINVWPDNPLGWGAAELKYRFQWNFPLFFSPHDPEALYAAGNVLFRSDDRGKSWDAVSPDLTRNDKSRMEPSGGPITKDNTSVEYYGTIFAAAESPLERGVLWTGSDDGMIHLSKDAGRNWTDVTPKDAPAWILINSIEPHPFEKGGLYVAGTMYKSDDFRPYLWKTVDWGAHWTRIDGGIDAGHFTRVIRADPVRRGQLYAGTERGVCVSFDDGERWQPLQLKLPVVPVTDLAVKSGDLVAATQGRGFWILDDLSPLRQLTAAVASKRLHLFDSRPALRGVGGGGRRAPENQGRNPPSGLVVHYRLGEPKPGTTVRLELRAEDGTVLREFSGKVKGGEPAAAPVSAAGPEPAEEPGNDDDEEESPRADPKLPAEAGMNRFVWDLRLASAKRFRGLILWAGGLEGPRIVPGRYSMRLTAGEESASAMFEVVPDPRSMATPADLKAQHDFLLMVRDKLSEIHEQIQRIREVRSQLDALRKRVADDSSKKLLTEAARELGRKLTTIEEALYQTKNRSRQDPLNFPIRINDKLASLGSMVAAGDFAPTSQALEVRTDLMSAANDELKKLAAVWSEEVPAFNRLARDHEIPAVIIERAPKE